MKNQERLLTKNYETHQPKKKKTMNLACPVLNSITEKESKTKASEMGKKESYHKINSIIAIVPRWICLDYNKRNMDSISLVLNIVRETFFPVYHKPNPFWFSQIQQQYPNKRHHHHTSHSPSLHFFKNHKPIWKITRIVQNKVKSSGSVMNKTKKRNKRVCELPQN